MTAGGGVAYIVGGPPPGEGYDIYCAGAGYGEAAMGLNIGV